MVDRSKLLRILIRTVFQPKLPLTGENLYGNAWEGLEIYLVGKIVVIMHVKYLGLTQLNIGGLDDTRPKKHYNMK